MQKYYSTVSSKMKLRTIEDHIVKTYANTRHILCPKFKSYFTEDKAALFRGDWEYSGKFKSSRKNMFDTIKRRMEEQYVCRNTKQ